VMGADVACGEFSPLSTTGLVTASGAYGDDALDGEDCAGCWGTA